MARRAGLSADAAIAGISSFPGLAHRQELVDTIDGVRYINDSKAANADATEKALACYEADVWIAGGPFKGEWDHVACAYCRAPAACVPDREERDEEFAATLNGTVSYTRCGNLATAVAAASDRARGERVPDAVVLLSPACASYDQFPNFEVRGDTFRALVSTLPGAHPSEAAEP